MVLGEAIWLVAALDFLSNALRQFDCRIAAFSVLAKSMS
jgi:hypothetical protein